MKILIMRNFQQITQEGINNLMDEKKAIITRLHEIFPTKDEFEEQKYSPTLTRELLWTRNTLEYEMEQTDEKIGNIPHSANEYQHIQLAFAAINSKILHIIKSIDAYINHINTELHWATIDQQNSEETIVEY